MAVAPTAARQRPQPKTPNEIYLEGELQKAIREREDIKRSLQAAGGPAVFWRQQAKDLSKKLGDQMRLVGGLRQAEVDERQHAIRFSEQADALRAQIDGLKLGLWELWSGLDDDNPAKQQLWSVWAALS